MEEFELDLTNMIKNLEFGRVDNVFQEQLKSSIKQIKTIIKFLFLNINLETLICYSKYNIQG